MISRGIEKQLLAADSHLPALVARARSPADVEDRRAALLRDAERDVRRSRPYWRISAIVPAPTVWPPSRIANRNPFSMATGVINSMVRLTLSPGITISVPAGNSATPVTSVVRR